MNVKYKNGHCLKCAYYLLRSALQIDEDNSGIKEALINRQKACIWHIRVTTGVTASLKKSILFRKDKKGQHGHSSEKA